VAEGGLTSLRGPVAAEQPHAGAKLASPGAVIGALAAARVPPKSGQCQTLALTGAHAQTESPLRRRGRVFLFLFHVEQADAI